MIMLGERNLDPAQAFGFLLGDVHALTRQSCGWAVTTSAPMEFMSFTPVNAMQSLSSCSSSVSAQVTPSRPFAARP